MASEQRAATALSFLALEPSKVFVGKKHRIARAVRWRLSAYQQDQKLKNLLRPTPRATTNPVKTVETKKVEAAQYRFRWGGSFFDKPVREKVVFYESFAGNGVLCNPLAIFEYLLSDPTKQDFEHVWSVRDAGELKQFNARYARYGNVRAVKYETDTYWQEICTAKYLINNATFPPYFAKRSEQIYINTWHGTPLKKMGYHANEGAFGARNIIRNFVQADYLISQNSHTTNTMYRDAYKLQGIFKGEIIEQGYPRVDAQFASLDNKDRFLGHLKESGVLLTGKPIVTYAPTWKGDSFHAPTNEAHQLLKRMKSLTLALGHKYDFILKVHQQVYKQAMLLPEISQYLVPNDIPTNEILGISETLITDYSSIFFDFLASEKPIIFFTPDQKEYHDNRGVYLEEVPGPVVRELKDLVQILTFADTATPEDVLAIYAPKRKNARLDYCGQEDGSATARIVDIIFNGNPDGLDTVSNFNTSKEKILLYIGGMRNNGITTSALNLLNNIDYSKYDISIWAPQPSKESPAFLFERIPSQVRQFLRQGTHPLTTDRHKSMNDFLSDSEFDGIEIPDKAREVFKAEWSRSFGSSSFDYIVDFSGYAGFWSFVLLQGTATKSRSVWQHNDLISDRDREVGGKKPNFTPLSSQFNSYRFFDNIVSVSDDLRDINRSNLSKFAHRNTFKACHNTVDGAKVERALLGTQDYSTVPTPEASISGRGLNDAIDAWLDLTSAERLHAEIDKRQLRRRLFATQGVTRFVTAGRMSPEKNQARLLNAFANVHEQRPHTELVLLGDGALRADLERLTIELGIQDVVFFAGMVNDALEIMKDCDCFVLSSDYEGQPMVILEASSVGIPVVTVSFASVRNSVGSDRGVVVEQSAEALADAMIDFVDGKIPQTVTFDYNEYNIRVMKEFKDAISLTA